MSDTLRGYTVQATWDGKVILLCDRCGNEVLCRRAPQLAAAVDAATEHSGRCLG